MSQFFRALLRARIGEALTFWAINRASPMLFCPFAHLNEILFLVNSHHTVRHRGVLVKLAQVLQSLPPIPSAESILPSSSRYCAYIEDFLCIHKTSYIYIYIYEAQAKFLFEIRETY